MLDEFVWDPQHPDLLWQEWLRDWNTHGDANLIAWALFDDERRLVDILVTDVEGEWIATDFTQGFEGIVEWAMQNKATNIIGLHMHPLELGEGPCDGLNQFCSVAWAELEDAGLRLRCTLVGNINGFDGMMLPRDPDAVPLPRPDLTNPIDFIGEGLRLRDVFANRDDLTDEEKAVFTEAIDTILADLLTGNEPDMDAVFRATDLAERKAKEMGIEMDMSIIDKAKAQHERGELKRKRKSEPKPDPLELPSLNLNAIRYLN